MDFGAALDVAIGLIFIYLLVSLFVTAVQEFIASKLNKRSEYLLKRISCLLSDGSGEWSPELTKVWNNPLIKVLKNDNVSEDASTPKKQLWKNAPSYVPGPAFAVALVDTLRPGGVANCTMDDLKSAVETMDNKELQAVLLPMITGAGDKLDVFQRSVGQWFDAAMDRTSGVYKRWAQRITFWLGFTAALLFNINTFGVIDTLWRDPVARAAVVAQAQEAELPPPAAVVAPESVAGEDDAEPSTAPASLVMAAETENRRRDANDAIRDLPLPVGWTWENLCQLSHYPHAGEPDKPRLRTGPGAKGYDFRCTGAPRGLAFTIWQILLTAGGLAVTGLAVSLGAPFWFGMLQTVTNIRSSGKKPDRTDGQAQK